MIPGPLRPRLRFLVLGLGLALLRAAAGEPVPGMPGAGSGAGGRAWEPGEPPSRDRETGSGGLEERAELGELGGRGDLGSSGLQTPRSLVRGSPIPPGTSSAVPASVSRLSNSGGGFCPESPDSEVERKFKGGMSRPVRGHAPSPVNIGSAQPQ